MLHCYLDLRLLITAYHRQLAPSSPTCSGICSFETKCREFLPSPPYRARSTSLASSSVDRNTVELLVMLPTASTFIVHLVWRMIRTPILPLSPGRPIFSLIRRNISSFWDEYFISLTSSCDVDIASTRRLASACRSLSHSTRVVQNVVRLSRSTVCETCSTVCETCSTVCETCSEVGSI